MSYLAVLQLLISIAILFALILVFHKVKKIHLSTYELESAAEETKNLFSQVQSFYALEKILNLNQPLPPLRGWAGSPDFLLRVAREILERKPGVVMECSSGVSTIVTARCLQLNGSGHVFSLEHDLTYAQKTRELVAAYGLSSWATVLHAPLQTVTTETPWYSEEVIPADLPPIDVLIVDGPPATTAPLARYPALPRLIGRMASNSIIIADDAARADETKMIERWKEAFPKITVIDCNCEKGCTLIRL